MVSVESGPQGVASLELGKQWECFSLHLNVESYYGVLPAMWETWVRSLGWEDPLEKEMATHSSIPAWTIPWTEEPGRLQSMESQRIGHDLVTKNKFQAKGHLVSTEACVGNGDCSFCSLSTRI